MSGRAAPAAPVRGVDAALLIVAVTWGTSYLAAKEVATAGTVFEFLVLRFALSVLLLGVVLLPVLRGLTREELRLGAIFGGILSVIFVLETSGVVRTTASNAGLIISLTVLMTPILERVARGVLLPRTFYAATVVAVLGVLCLTQTQGLTAPRSGDLLMLAAAAVRAIHITTIAHLSEGKQLDSRRLTLVQLATALVLFVAVSIARGSGPSDIAATLGDYDAKEVLLLVYLALVCTLFAFLVQLWAVRHTSPSRVSLLLGTEPLWAAVAGVTLGGDPFGVLSVVGAVLVLTGTNWGRRIDGRRSAEGGGASPPVTAAELEIDAVHTSPDADASGVPRT